MVKGCASLESSILETASDSLSTNCKASKWDRSSMKGLHTSEKFKEERLLTWGAYGLALKTK